MISLNCLSNDGVTSMKHKSCSSEPLCYRCNRLAVKSSCIPQAGTSGHRRGVLLCIKNGYCADIDDVFGAAPS